MGMIIDWKKSFSPILMSDSFEDSGTVTKIEREEFQVIIGIRNEQRIVTKIFGV